MGYGVWGVPRISLRTKLVEAQNPWVITALTVYSILTLINIVYSKIFNLQTLHTHTSLTFFMGCGVLLSPSFLFFVVLDFHASRSSWNLLRTESAMLPTSDSSPLNVMALFSMSSISVSNASTVSYLSASSFCRIVLRSRAFFRGMISK